MLRLPWVAALVVACAAAGGPVPVQPAGQPAEQRPGPGGEWPPFSSDDEVLEFLRSAGIVELREIPVGVTKPRVATLERAGVRARAVFHHHHRVKEKARMEDGSFVMYFRDSYLNQPAAYELGRQLGLTNIPPTVLREVGGSEGSLQLWIENVRTESDRIEEGLGFPDRLAAWRQVYDMDVFDALINNLDRSQPNFLWGRDDWRLWLIDHTRAFGRDTDVREPKTIRKISRRLWKQLQELDTPTIETTLEPYMGRLERSAVRARQLELIEIIRDKIALEGESEVLFDYDDPTSPVDPGD